MKLYLLRHAECMSNAMHIMGDHSVLRNDDVLTERGRRQAAALARRLGRYRFDAVIVSPLIRTRETVEPYLEKRRVKLIMSKLTIERNTGSFAGQHLNAIRDHCRVQGLDIVTFRPKGGESLLDVYARARRFLAYLERRYRGKSVLVVSHAFFLRCLEMAITKRDIRDFYEIKGLENAELKEYNL
jgi:broad specificity phosphatase PhoE